MSITYRAIELGDHALICHHREAMFRDMGRSEQFLNEMRQPFAEWLAPRLADKRYTGVVAEYEGQQVAGAGVFLTDWPPSMDGPSTHARGFILNVYTEPSFRRRGIARQLMALCEKECANRGLSAARLHASDEGRPLYESMGWLASNEMTKNVTG